MIKLVQRGRAHKDEKDLHYRCGGDGEFDFTSIGSGGIARRVAFVQFWTAFFRAAFFGAVPLFRGPEPELFKHAAL